uniref:Uncharacterized protein n=1 Tax=Nothobranchius furzeri TaxID=105023 RepID=A0A8C6PMR1_NOTFU
MCLFQLITRVQLWRGKLLVKGVSLGTPPKNLFGGKIATCYLCSLQTFGRIRKQKLHLRICVHIGPHGGSTIASLHEGCRFNINNNNDNNAFYLKVPFKGHKDTLQQ